MEMVPNKKDFKVVKITKEEAIKLGFGIIEGEEHLCVCMGCNNDCEDKIYYIPVLNDTFCNECYEMWINNPGTIRYEEDSPFEDSNFEYIKEQLTQ